MFVWWFRKIRGSWGSGTELDIPNRTKLNWDSDCTQCNSCQVLIPAQSAVQIAADQGQGQQESICKQPESTHIPPQHMSWSLV